MEILRYLKYPFPSIVRVTSYAQIKTLSKKRPKTLAPIHDAGSDRLHIGLELIEEGIAPN